MDDTRVENVVSEKGLIRGKGKHSVWSTNLVACSSYATYQEYPLHGSLRVTVCLLGGSPLQKSWDPPWGYSEYGNTVCGTDTRYRTWENNTVGMENDKKIVDKGRTRTCAGEAYTISNRTP
jgi:hypothetical protein